ncbi:MULTISPECIES: uroporphyrinogen-III C-methyltransferase [Aliivibrio]|uniref:Heme biosynthesis operon protein HemX n=2 Tax=Aliivibrio logei TaxID=688 RepID=A0A1B9NVS2_ALILO|nr:MULTISPECIES: uroporphyrinogen-III C-methyltransferase [Aliivibrio]MBB1313639.1 uroporphyrinogen-III C-methyltransferase [Aliivibrio sp. SR45-2]OCH18669.1 heme biosynthesis operon protein HemX [Aliivibrio logei]OEF22704.1 heme biosynthesis operon protein HemX [Aliivibrio logei 5S-186]
MTKDNNKPQSAEEKSSNSATAPSSQIPKKETEKHVQPTTSKAPSNKEEPVVDKKSRRLGTVAIIISILLSGGAFLASQQQVTQQQLKIAQLQQQLKNADSTFDAKLVTAEQRITDKADDIVRKATVLIQQQDKSIASLQLAIADVKGRRPNDWLLAEADYLVKMAGRKLWLEHDVVSATRLMENADQRISALNDPSLMPLRRAMASDISTLKAIPLIDRDGLVLKLNSLEQQINTLPLASAILPEAGVVEQKEVSTNINDWQSNLMQSLDDFAGHFITYRVREGNVIPLLSPEQHFYLKENIKGKLLLASKALYREQSEVYVTSLESAKLWSSQYFQQDDPAVKSFMAQLDSLTKFKVDVRYPQKMKTQALLSDFISERLRRNVQAVSTTTPETKTTTIEGGKS